MENNVMSPEEFKEQMKNIENDFSDDPEESHYEMDDLMCRVLESLGYSEGIDIFTNSMRWYA